jgi:hypothetical protein
LTLAAVSLDAHHSIAGMYDGSRETRVEGVITRVQFVSPHPFIDVREIATSASWELELDNRREFEAIGITADSFKAGDRVVVTGSPARRDANRLYVQRLSRLSDGFGFEQVGSRPRLSGRGR